MLAPEISEESTKTVLLALALQGLSCERVFGDSMTPELHAGLQSKNSDRRQYIRLIKDKKQFLSAARHYAPPWVVAYLAREVSAEQGSALAAAVRGVSLCDKPSSLLAAGVTGDL